MNFKQYDRVKAKEYAKKWAYSRNPKYYNFDNIGGDCTSFVSQCIYNGSGVMNYNKNTGWYYNSINNRSPSWTGVDFFYKFLINNKGIGPRGEVVGIDRIQIGDVVQLKFDENMFSHTLIIVNIKGELNLKNIYVASHSYDSYNRRVLSYNFQDIRFIHIEKITIW